MKRIIETYSRVFEVEIRELASDQRECGVFIRQLSGKPASADQWDKLAAEIHSEFVRLGMLHREQE